MTKSCQCGQVKTEGKPDYCGSCKTFTHEVYNRLSEPKRVEVPEPNLAECPVPRL